MNKKIIAGFLAVLLLSVGGCGYTTETKLPNDIKTIAVPTFTNKIPIDDVYTYVSGLEVRLTNAVINRLIFDGNLKVVGLDEADAVLVGELKSYEQEPVRFTNTESVEEYRLFIVTKLELRDQRTNEIIWVEPSFSGDTEYFVTGPKAISERQAAEKAIEDLARNIVDRIVEDW